jgi:putative transposase
VAEALATIPELSERQACRLLGWSRASQRYEVRVRARDERMKALLPGLAREAPREGQRRVRLTVLERCEAIGKNAFHRIWKLLQLQVKPHKKKRTRRKPLPEAIGLRATGPNQIWCMDFMKDWTLGGRPLRILSVVDEFTRECLALVAAPSFKAEAVVAQLDWLAYERGAPVRVRSDNGPEFIATTVATWAEAVKVRLVRSAPGCPWHNAYAESIHSRIRDEFTEMVVFGSLAEAMVLCEAYRKWYNTARRHSSLAYQTPAAFAAKVKNLGLVLGHPGLVGAAA